MSRPGGRAQGSQGSQGSQGFQGSVSAEVGPEVIDAGAVLARVGGDEDGAVLLFLGTVRNHADGRSVRGMRYDAYDAMAREVLSEIAREAARETGAERLHVVHRTGELDIGEISVAIAVSTPHREEAYRASRYVIEEIKKRLPVWKKEAYTDGDDAWVEGRDPREAGRTGGSRGSRGSRGGRGGREVVS